MAFSSSFRFSAGPTRDEVTLDLTSWYKWDGASLATLPAAVYLPAPDKWRDTGAKWKRSADSRGLIRSISTPYSFVLEFASVLRSVYYNGSIQSKVFFLIERLNTDTIEYEIYFQGEIDLSTFSDGVLYNGGSVGVGATVEEGGISAALDAAGNTPYQIPLTPAACDFIFMDGLRLRGTYNYLTPATGSTNFTNGQLFMPSNIFTTQEGNYPVATPNTAFYRNAGNYAFSSFSGTSQQIDDAYNNDLLNTGQELKARVNVYYPNFYYSNDSGSSGSISLRVEVLVVAGNAASPYNYSQRFVVFSDTLRAPGWNGTVGPIDVSTPQFTMGYYDRVYVVHSFEGSSTPYNGDFNYGEGAVHIATDFAITPTICASKPLRTVVSELLTQITGLPDVLQSSYLTNPNARYYGMNPYNVRLTCGDALRNLTKNAAGTINITPAIKISWDDMKKYLRDAHGCGIDVRGGKVVIEKTAFFFNQSQVIAEVGAFKSMKVGPAREYMVNAFKYGYPVQSYDKLNGRDEPNTTVTWKGPITKFSEVDYTVNIRTDPYGIEEARANLANKKTTDASSDNDTFATETEQNMGTVTVTIPSAGTTINYLNVYRLYRPQNSITQPLVTGFIFPESMFNLTMLPILNLYRNGGEVRAMFYNQPGAVLRFQTTDKNPEIRIDLGFGVIDATRDIPVADLDAPSWKPVQIDAEGIMPHTFLSSMRNVPGGCIAGYENGVRYKGFPLDVGVAGADDNSYQMVLLCTVDTDLTPKIG